MSDTFPPPTSEAQPRPAVYGPELVTRVLDNAAISFLNIEENIKLLAGAIVALSHRVAALEVDAQPVPEPTPDPGPHGTYL